MVRQSPAAIQSLTSKAVIGTNPLILNLAAQPAEALGQAALTVLWSHKSSRPGRDLVLPAAIPLPIPGPSPMAVHRREGFLAALAPAGIRAAQESCVPGEFTVSIGEMAVGAIRTSGTRGCRYERGIRDGFVLNTTLVQRATAAARARRAPTL